MQARTAFVSHYYRADRKPFQSLSEMADGDIELATTDLHVGSRRRFGPHYLALRRATEAAARKAFVALGGRPERYHPHYFVLGESRWFAGLYDETLEVRVALADLPPEVTSFTWADSITALGLGEHLGVPQPPRQEERLVYRLDQLDLVTASARAGTDAADPYVDYQTRLIDHYVEIQLWADGPVQQYL